MERRQINSIMRCVLVAALLCLGGCDFITERVFTWYLEPSPPDVQEGVMAYRDIVYAHRPERELMLDVYLPAERDGEPLPVVLFLFGGGWEVGNRHQFIRLGLDDYPQHGFALVTADYRYLQEAIFPAQYADVAAAIDWIRNAAGDYGIDASRIGVVGPSAGGHLAALAGTINREQEIPAGVSVNAGAVQAVVDYYGPTDFLQADPHLPEGAKLWSAPDSGISRLLGAPLLDAPDRAKIANPITYIDGSEPPFLIIHGDKDSVVPLQQSEILQEALQAAGVHSELVVVKDGDHGYGGDFFTEMPTTRMLDFFQLHLQPATLAQLR